MIEHGLVQKWQAFRPRIWVAALGVLGLIGLLFAARMSPSLASVLQPAAFLWFIALGPYETVWRPYRRRW